MQKEIFTTIAIMLFLAVIAIIIYAPGWNKQSQQTGISTVIQNQNIPEPTGYVVDKADLIDENGEKFLTESIKSVVDHGKSEIAVLTIDSLNGLSIEEFGIRVAEKWKVGKYGVDDGVILIISKKDRKVRIELGRGSKITDAQAKDIINNKMIPKLKAEEWEDAILDGIGALINLS